MAKAFRCMRAIFCDRIGGRLFSIFQICGGIYETICQRRKADSLDRFRENLLIGGEKYDQIHGGHYGRGIPRIA